ncbi:hypothetical protein V0288_19195 [Pannus brasiliensis CCIBt3594]|uniref:Uncharacterized protein n=1 Tax=Pannus brasiliensis CCIBt3594 TaxID=1427578 RepID=A0AAW9QN99_9CHRO
MIGNIDKIAILLAAVRSRDFGQLLATVVEGVDRDDWLSLNFTLFQNDDRSGMQFVSSVVRYCDQEFPDSPIFKNSTRGHIPFD